MRAQLTSIQIISGASLATSYNSPTINVSNGDIACVELDYTGSPVGSIALQGSVSGTSWSTLYLTVNGSTASSIPVPANSSPILLDFSLSGIPYLRVVYTSISGSGSLNAYLSYHRVGA